MDFLKTLVPLLGVALGGPLGGAAASFVADKLGLESKTVEAVTAALSSGTMTPEQVANLKLAEIDFQKFLEANKIDLAKIEAADRSDARDMHKTVHSRMPATLTLLITFGFFGVLGYMLNDRSAIDNPPLLIMLGSLGTAWSAAQNIARRD